MAAIIVTEQHLNHILVLLRHRDPYPYKLVTGNAVNVPAGLAIDDDGSVVVVDTGGNRVVVIDRWSAITNSYCTLGSGSFQLFNPIAIAIDPWGRHVVLDAGNHRIVRYDPAALPPTNWITFNYFGKPDPERPDGAGLLADPRSVAIDHQGRVLVTDPGTGRIIRMNDLDGTGWMTVTLPQAPFPAIPFGVTASYQGIAITDVANRLVYWLDSNLSVIGTLDAATDGIQVPAWCAATGNQSGAIDLAIADPALNEVRLYQVDIIDQPNGLLSARFSQLDRLRGSNPEYPQPLFEQLSGLAIGGR